MWNGSQAFVFCFLFAVVMPILGWELRRKCQSENKTIRLVLILQSAKGFGGVHVHVLDPEIPTKEFKPWSLNGRKETLNPLPLSSRLKSMSTMPFVYYITVCMSPNCSGWACASINLLFLCIVVQIQVRILEGRQLAGTQIDPVCTVNVGNQKKSTTIKEQTNCPFWDEVRRGSEGSYC